MLIVGGGIGGLSTAFALSRLGLQIRVLEQARTFGEVGAGIQIAPNCTRILDDYGLLDGAMRLGVLPTSMVMRDAIDGRDLTYLDLTDLQRRYGFPYMVIHRSDLHGIILRACESSGVDLRTDQAVVNYRNDRGGGEVVLADGRVEHADLVIAADGLHSVARRLLVADEPVNSGYVAYRGVVRVEEDRADDVDLSEIAAYVGPGCHFVHYGLRGGELLNQVAVLRSAKAHGISETDTDPDELEAAFAHTCEFVRRRIPAMWRDRLWKMFDRDPIDTWVHGRIALLGDAAHPPLQYMAQGAIMAIEDGWVLAHHLAENQRLGPNGCRIDYDAALAAYEAVRPEHCRRVVMTARAWGQLWHLDGMRRLQRNSILRARDTYDYGFTDWIYGPTALLPDQEPPLYRTIPLDSVDPLAGV